MKILFIEDELLKHVDKIESLFSPVMTKKMRRKFEELLEDEDTDSSDIKNLFSAWNIVDIASTFPEALDLIVNHMEEYALFIVDRNLFSDTYEHDDIVEILPEYSEEFYDKFAEREGDYILEYLLSRGVDCASRLFMLTANSDPLRNAGTLEDKIHFKQFQSENIIIKDDLENESRLRNLIADNDQIMIRVEHPEIFLLEKYPEIRPKHAEIVASVLKNIRYPEKLKQADIDKELGALRIVVTGLLEDINKIPILNYHNLKSGEITERKKINSLDGNPKTAILKPYSDYIYTLASELSLHENDINNLAELKKVEYCQSKGLPTIHTLHSAISALKDIFKYIDIHLRDVEAS